VERAFFLMATGADSSDVSGALRSHAPLERVLDDGLAVRLRPVVPDDHGRILRAYDLLSEESRLNRFWERPANLSDNRAARLSNTDDADHVSWIALDPADDAFPGFGGASYWRDPVHPGCAELSFTIADAWQRRGLATLLYSILWFEGWKNGVRHFTGECRKSNLAMVRWWTAMGGRIEEGSRHVDLDLPLENPEFFLERISYEARPSYCRIEVATWLRDWQETTFS
jgi:RimJ/RimL family protein N-acetyltransferase